MNRAVMTLLSLSVAGSLLALLLFAGKQLFGKRLSRTFCYYVWLLVLARLVVPVSAPVNAIQILSEKAQVNSGLALTQNAPPDHFAVSSGNGTGETFTAPQAASSGPDQVATAAISPWTFVKANLFWFWLAGALLCFGWFVSTYLVFAHRTKRSFTAPDAADAALFHELCKGRRVAFFCGNVGTPMLLGLFRPKIIVPRCAYVQSGREGELRDILHHELTHFRRHDLLYKWAVIVVSSAHWFNPLLFWIRKEISRACELSCDEMVIRDMSTIEKQRYGETLLSLSSDRRLSAGIPATTLCEEKEQLRERLLSIMRYRKRTTGTVVLSALVLAVLTGCASVLGGTSVKPSAFPASETASTAALLTDAVVYDANGYKLGIPKEYADQVLVFTDPPDDGTLGETIVSVSGKQSYEASGKNGVGHGGFLFAFDRLTQGQYEQFLSQGDWSGQSIFAKDDQYYYCCCTATDVQYYPSSGTQIDVNSDEYKQWLKLLEQTMPIEQDFIARNHLTAFSDNDVRSQPYTYDSKHMEIKYYPYYSINGSKDEYMRLILSQPVKQGEGGIWCVERFYDNAGNQYLWYPDKRYYEAVTGEKAGSETFTAADCYAAMQKLSDSGKDKSFLDPLSVAKKFTLNCGYWQSDSKLVDGSFEIVQS